MQVPLHVCPRHQDMCVPRLTVAGGHKGRRQALGVVVLLAQAQVLQHNERRLSSDEP